jgi:hypothetical protein
MFCGFEEFFTTFPIIRIFEENKNYHRKKIEKEKNWRRRKENATNLRDNTSTSQHSQHLLMADERVWCLVEVAGLIQSCIS